jgi:hypothetical protein
MVQARAVMARTMAMRAVAVKAADAATGRGVDPLHTSVRFGWC